MDQDQLEIITANDRNSAEIQKPAGAAVSEAINAHEGSEEPYPWIESPNESTSDVQEAQAGKSEMTDVERRIRTLAKVKWWEPTELNLWKVAFEDFSEKHTKLQNLNYKREEEMRSVKNEIYQVVGFFSAFQGLLITAAAQSNLLRCNNVGFILALSAFATAIAVFGIWQKRTAMEQLRSTIDLNARRMQDVKNALNYLEDRGQNFRFSVLSLQPNVYYYSSPWWKENFGSFGTWLVASVIAFGGLCMVAMRQIVCNPGASLPSN